MAAGALAAAEHSGGVNVGWVLRLERKPASPLRAAGLRGSEVVCGPQFDAEERKNHRSRAAAAAHGFTARVQFDGFFSNQDLT